MYMSNTYVNFLDFHGFLHLFVIKYELIKGIGKYTVKHKLIFYVCIEKKNAKNNIYESYGQSTKLTCTYSCLTSHAISPAYTPQLHIHFFARLFFTMRDFPALSCLTSWYNYLTTLGKKIT